MQSFARLSMLVVLGCLVAGPAVAQSQDPASEEFARRRYESGLAFLQEQKFSEALKDFQAVVDQYPASRVVDAALLQIASYQLDRAGDPVAAQTATETLLNKYPTSESAPMAHVLAGRIVLARGRAAADVETALASFERVSRLFPASDAVPAAMYYAGEALRMAHREEEAVFRYRQVSTDYPLSTWSARALLGEGRCLVIGGKATPAMEQLQRVRQRFPGSPEAATALAWNTILYRLYLRPSSLVPYTFTGKTLGTPTARLRDVVALGIGARDQLLVVTKNGVTPYKPDGTAGPVIPAASPQAVCVDRKGRTLIAGRGAVEVPGESPVPLAIPRPDGKLRTLEDIPAIAATSFGELLVADKGARAVVRFGEQGKLVGPFATTDAARLAVNASDDLAALDRDGRAVFIYDHDGRSLSRLSDRGTGWQFENLVDVAFDPLGHLYVLDRGRGAVFVFGPKNALIASFAPPEKAPGAFRRAAAMAVDTAGRLYIYDDRDEQVLIFK